MIQSAAPAPSHPAAAKPRETLSSSGRNDGHFARSLADFLDSADTAEEAPPARAKEPDERHDDAANGNGLPGDADPPAPDARLIWFASPPAVPTPPIRPIVFAGFPVAQSPDAAIADAATLPPPVPGDAIDRAATDDTLAPSPLTGKVAPDKADGGPRPDIKANAPGSPSIGQPQTAATAPPSAATVFAAAIHAATMPEERIPSAHHEDKMITTVGPSGLEVGAISVPGTSDAQKAPLDLRQDRWPGALIDRIEAMRDAADAADTRIRLVPDALGSIDVSLRKQGDTVHVHFAAEQAATRTILHDAQPRLAELAESRGLKLGQTGVGGSDTGDGQQPPRQPRATERTTPPPAESTTQSVSGDTRIA